MVFNIQYICDANVYAKVHGVEVKEVELGKVINYQEGPDETVENQIELGCDVISFPVFVNIFDTSFNPSVKVDIKTKKLVNV